MKGYKGFNPGLICRGKQYKENTVFEEDRAKICKSGMHFCENPFDVLNYYPLVNEDGSFSDFAEVEALEKAETDDNEKFCTKKLRIGAKLSFGEFVRICVDFVIKKTRTGDSAQIGSSGNSAQIGSSGNSAQIGSSGNSARIGSSGYSAQIGSSGDYAQIGSSGNSAQIGSSGDSARIGSSGYSAQIGSSGYSTQIGSSGDYAQIGSAGDYAKIGNAGDYAKIGSAGYYAKIGSAGHYAQIGSSGNSVQIGSAGDFARIGNAGDFARINCTGANSVICCAGNDSAVKAKAGCWITLSEWEQYDDEWIPVCVKTEYVDGEKIKADTWYKLKNGQFVEVQEDE